MAHPGDFGTGGVVACYVVYMTPHGWDFEPLRDYAKRSTGLPQARVVEGTAALAAWASKHLKLASLPPKKRDS